MSIWKHTIYTNLNFRKEQITSIQDANFMYKTISLPGNRVFVIGGSKDISGNNCTQQTLELVDGKFE